MTRLTLVILMSALLSACATTQPKVSQPSETENNLTAAAEHCPTVEPVVCPVCPKVTIPAPKIIYKVDTSKAIWGQVEYVYIDELKQFVEARIDTGATTTSMAAYHVEPFERDGKSFVRFHYQPDGKDTAIERPVVRKVAIKRKGAKDDIRYVVNLYLKAGKINTWTEVSLADRSNFEYKLLIGRNFLRDRVIVDVSKEHTMGHTQ